jgi:hypothetical protein
MLDSKLEEYINAFKEGFPMIPLAWGRTEAEIIDLIDRCLKEGKNAYDLGLVKEDDDILF